MKTYTTIKPEEKLCGNRTYNSSNCHNKIRKISSNAFETITLIGKHAFNYQVVIKNNKTGHTKITDFPLRKQAVAFFILSEKKYK